MLLTQAFIIALAAEVSSAQETVLGVYIFSRHGDRTAKTTPPANLTDLGYQEIFTSGTYFRNRYVALGASSKILGMNNDLVRQSQITASAPVDTVLMNSATAFLQGLYPPVGNKLGSNALRNGTVIQSPLNGYQLIPLQQITTGANSEDSAWLQGATNCANAQISSNEYYSSPAYMETLHTTQPLYDHIAPMVNLTFSADQISYKNAYTIWDLLNVASIHNATFPSSSLLTDDVFSQLRSLADQHEWNLAYNISEPIRAVTGSILAAQVTQALNATITGKGKSKMNIQFGAYAGMQSFFGLANLTQLNADFYGVPDYASSLTWELVTNASTETGFPSASDISVRFLFHNGTTSNTSEPVAYPLFGQSHVALQWTDFVSGMNQFAIGSQQDWCRACGNGTGVCAAGATEGSGGNPGSSSSRTSTPSGGGGGGGISKAVAGVIGAMVTLAVVLGAELLIMLVGGVRLVSKRRLAGNQGSQVSVNEAKI